MHFIVVAANIFVLFAIAFIARRRIKEAGWFWPALVLKVCAGLALGWMYLHLGYGDTLNYFEEAGLMAEAARSDLRGYLHFLWTSEASDSLQNIFNLSQPRALFFSKFASVLSLLTGHNYWLMATWLSLISFLAALQLVIEIIRFRPALAGAAVFAFMFLPSAVFWSSGLIKESLAIASVYVIVACFLLIWQQRRLAGSWYVIVPVALWTLWRLKYYYFAVLIPVLATELLYTFLLRRRLENQNRVLRAGVWLAILLVPVALVTRFHPNFQPSVFFEVIMESHREFVRVSDPENLIHYESLAPDLRSLVIHAPKALLSGLFRPFVWEARSLPNLLAALENLGIIILTATALHTLVRENRWRPARGTGLVLIYSFALCVLLALSVPNLGTLSRFRVGFLPFFVFVLCGGNPVFNRGVAVVQSIARRLVK